MTKRIALAAEIVAFRLFVAAMLALLIITVPSALETGAQDGVFAGLYALGVNLGSTVLSLIAEVTA